MNQILKSCPDLRTVYLLKEEFRTILEKVKNREQAARSIDAWILKAERTGDKFLAKFIGTLKNWRDQILNYFIERISNGFVEGTNNALRTIIRTAFGYRDSATSSSGCSQDSELFTLIRDEPDFSLFSLKREKENSLRPLRLCGESGF